MSGRRWSGRPRITALAVGVLALTAGLIVVDGAVGAQTTTLPDEGPPAEGPRPVAPGVDLQPGSTGENHTILRIAGEAGTQYRVQIIRESVTYEDFTGSVDGEGRAAASILLANGPWGYIVTLRNGSATSEGTLARFDVEIGPPPPPQLEVVSEPGRNPIEIAVSGPPEGKAVVATSLADGDGSIEENVDLDFEGRKTVGLEVSEDGTWEVSAVVTDFQDQASGPSALAEGVVVDTEPPSLTVAPLGAASDEFGYLVTTDIGAQVTVQSESEALVDSFVAEEERTEIRVPVAAGDHTVTVIAGDEFGNEARDVLAREVGGGGGFPVLILIIAAIIVVFGIFAFLKRDELRDWWYSRQYH